MREGVLRSDVPEVTFEESRVEGEDVLMEPGVHCSLSVVSTEGVTALLWPEIHHLANSHCERIGEDSSQVSSKQGTGPDQRTDWHVGVSPED